MKSLLLVSVFVLLGVAVGIRYAALGVGSRVPTWLGGAGDLDSIEAQIDALESEVASLEKEAELLASDPFAIERAIREHLRMAKSAEIVIRLGGNTRTNPRFP